MGLDLTGFGSAFDFAQTVIEKIWPPTMDPEKRAAAEVQLQAMIHQRDQEVEQAKKEVLVAELQQGDLYTKRARPTVVYAGLIFIFLVNVIFPFILNIIATFNVAEIGPSQIARLEELKDMKLPTEFWIAWGSVVSVWSIGRSAEKRGTANKIVSALTGNK